MWEILLLPDPLSCCLAANVDWEKRQLKNGVEGARLRTSGRLASGDFWSPLFLHLLLSHKQSALDSLLLRVPSSCLINVKLPIVWFCLLPCLLFLEIKKLWSKRDLFSSLMLVLSLMISITSLNWPFFPTSNSQMEFVFKNNWNSDHSNGNTECNQWNKSVLQLGMVIDPFVVFVSTHSSAGPTKI